jgi:hypothetical protein
MKSPLVSVRILATEKEPWTRIEESGQSFSLKDSSDISYTWYFSDFDYSHRFVHRFSELLTKIFRASQTILEYTPNRRMRALRATPGWISDFIVRNFTPMRAIPVNLRGGRAYALPGVPDGFSCMGLRTLQDMDTFLKSDSEFYVRANSTCFVNETRLLEICSSLGSRLVYAGQIEMIGSLQYVSGAFVVMSRDVVAACVANADSWNHAFMDDVALGLLISKIGIAVPIALPRFNFPLHGTASALSKSQFDCYSSFRCKSLDPDVAIQRMKALANLAQSQVDAS